MNEPPYVVAFLDASVLYCALDRPATNKKGRPEERPKAREEREEAGEAQ
jgi:hypothetical protein